MPKRTRQKQRLLYVLKFLLEQTDENHKLTVANIIEKLAAYGIDADRKTVTDDLDTLELCCGELFDYDIQRVKGADGGTRVLSRPFEVPELILLANAVQSSRFVTEKKSNALIDKLASLTSVHQGKQLKRQVKVKGRIKNMVESVYNSTDSIHNAIAENKKISFLYYEYDKKGELVPKHGGKPYVASPLTLWWDDEFYYLVAYDSDAEMIKHYRVDKMKRLEIVDLPRDGTEDFDPAEYTNKLFGMFGGNEVAVRLRCNERLIGMVIDRFGKGNHFRNLGNGYFVITIKVMLSPVFYGWVLSFGGDIVIESPDIAIEELKKTARAAVSIYEEDEK